MAMVAARLSWLIVAQRFICVGQVFPRSGGDRGWNLVPEDFAGVEKVRRGRF